MADKITVAIGLIALLLIFPAMGEVIYVPPQNPTITGLTLSGTSYASGSSAGTAIGTFTLGGASNGAATLALSGPDAARFQLSSPCTGASCSLQYSGTNPDGYADGKFLVFVTPTLAGARGSGVVYPFTINATVTCNQTVASGGTQTNIAAAITAASGGQTVCFADGGTYTVSSSVAVNKALRLTGVNSKVLPTLTLSASVPLFNVSVGSVRIDHLNGVGPGDTSSSEGCGGVSNFVSTSTINTLDVDYTTATGFICTHVFAGVTNSTFQYNWMKTFWYTGFICNACVTVGTISNNIAQDVPSGASIEANAYPFVISGTSLSTGPITFTNNTAMNNPIWECFDNHGSVDIRWASNYCLAPNGNTGMNIVGGNAGGTDGAQPITRPRSNNNVVDQGSATCSGCNSIVMTAATGDTMTCTGGDGNGCQNSNNTILGFGGSGSVCNACDGSVSGTFTHTGNTFGSVATMAAPALTTDQPANGFVAGQANGVIGKISVVATPAFPAWVGGWPNYGGWPGSFSIGGADAAQFAICVDGQHVCQSSGGVAAGTYHITLTGTLNGLSNSPQTSGTLTLVGS